MPTYEYECAKCGHAFERFQQMSDEPVKTCPSCKSRRVKRLLGGGAGLLFKGSGFYITDYRSGSYKEAAGKDSGGGASPDKAAAPAPAAATTAAAPAAPAKEKAAPAKKATKSAKK